MSEPRLISPLLDGYAMGGAISSHSGVSCYPAMHQASDERYIVKTISIPSSQVQLDALLLSGAYRDTKSAGLYFRDLALGVREEAEILNKLAAQRGFLPFDKFQIVPMKEGTGFEVYLVSPYRLTLQRHMSRNPMTHLSAVNMGIDLCAALAVCREAGYLYVDLKPGNIFMPGEQEFYLGDLGFVALDSLKYASLPDRYRSVYTAPEVSDAYSQLNTTMDIYALGLVLYQVYNNGQLPFDSEESRAALMARLAQGEIMEAPAYADYEMAEIILKACAYDPAARYQTPIEMGQALIAYMQRNTVNNVPIVPPVIEEPVAQESAAEEAPASEAPAEAPAEETQAAPQTPEQDSPAEEAAPETSSSETPAAEEAPAEEQPQTEASEESADTADAGKPEEPALEDSPAEPEKPAEPDWIDRMDAILAEDGVKNPAETEDIPLRVLMENDADVPVDVSAEELSHDTASMLNLAQELIEHEAPQPAVAPEPIEIPMPEPIVLTEPEPDAPEQPESPEPAEAAQTSPEGEKISIDQIIQDVMAEPKENTVRDLSAGIKRRGWKRFFSVVLILLILAAAATVGYYVYENYYLQAVDAFTLEGGTDEIQVFVDTDMKESLLTVVCKDTSGTTLTSPLTDGQASFAGLTPGTQYTISLEISGTHKLTGFITPLVYYTPAQSQIISLTATTGAEDGSVVISFGVEGPDSEEWTLTYSAEGEESQTMVFSGHTVTVTGLSVGSTYSFTLTGTEDIILAGENTISFTASEVIYAQNISVAGRTDGSLTVNWEAPEGAAVTGWVARCYNEDGFDQKLDVSETTATFTDVEASAGYTIEITAAGMTQGKLVYITNNPITISDVKASTGDFSINLTWDYVGTAPEEGWLVLYTVDGGEQQVLQASEASAVISPAAPGSSYEIVIQSADSSSVFGGTLTVEMPAITTKFSGFKLSSSNIEVTSYAAPDKNNWTRSDLGSATTTFAPGSSMALTYRTKSKYNVSYTEVTSMFVIRDAEGRLASIGSKTRTWEAMWESGWCTEEISLLPSTPGEYTLEIYVDGGLLTNLSFTIE